MLKEVESNNGSCGEPETALSDYMACVSGSIPTSLYAKKQADEPSAFLYGAGEGNIPLSRPPSAPRCGLRTLTAVFWVFACDRIHPDSPPLRLYGLRLGFNSHFIICKKQTAQPSAFLHGAGEGNIPLSRPPSAPRCGLRTLTAVFWVFACDRIHPDSPPLRLYGLRLGFNSHFIICKKQTAQPSAFLHGAGEGN